MISFILVSRVVLQCGIIAPFPKVHLPSILPHDDTQYPSRTKAYGVHAAQLVSFAETLSARYVWVWHDRKALSRFESISGPRPHGFGDGQTICTPHSVELLCLHNGTILCLVSRNLHPVVYLSTSHGFTTGSLFSHLFCKIAKHSDANQLPDQALSLNPSHVPHAMGARKTGSAELV